MNPQPAMETKLVTFKLHIPSADGSSVARTVDVQVPARLDQDIGEWVLTEEAHDLIENRKAEEIGLLSPEQLRDLRTRHGLGQKQIGALFQVGEKSWCRWESGKHRPSRSINLLIRALYDGEISLKYLRHRAEMRGPAGEWELQVRQAIKAVPRRRNSKASPFQFPTGRPRCGVPARSKRPDFRESWQTQDGLLVGS
jgi:DNA-binding transcriptional regulator YiaG